MVRAFIGIAAVALLAGCDSGTQKADAGDAEQQILAQEEAWNRAYAQRDGEALAGFYADDAAVASPGDQLVRGKDSIRQGALETAKDPNLQISFRANKVQVASSGDLGYTRGQYMMTSTNPGTNAPESTRGYYLTVWQKQGDGQWKVVEDFITPGPALPVADRATAIL